MSKVKPTTKEQLIDYFIRYLSLGTYDKRFLSNLQNLNVATNKPVTTNQSDLFDKIITRYHRQLSKREIDSKDMIALHWKISPVESSPQYTQAYISIEDDKILLRSPYKKEFVKNLKELSYMAWDRETKIWSSPVAEFILRDVIHLVADHYDNINYCDTVKDIVDEICKYEDAKYWNPTFVKLKGNLYVVATNENLMGALANVPLEQNLKTLARLTSLSVKIDESVVESMDEPMSDILFATNNDPTLEQNNLADVVHKFKSIGADYVLICEWFASSRELVSNLTDALKSNNIDYKVVKFKLFEEMNYTAMNLHNYSFPVLLNVGLVKYKTTPSPFFKKQISLVNSTPIELKE